ncbi:hypothetical protein BSY18_1855 [Blastomonas sp. RAC04]|uniref:DUF4238 domain-containing protein n=1 Tax=Blastomonas sp. RAC04 TaxID=1842535 RepID=UPI00085896D7|nr:DUF4238 domain-containing protein [Blastomonas sp. RAC04]AOG00964.1 hypothetical protein BSY18_1855 [Blastomonas sp. RAC04]
MANDYHHNHYVPEWYQRRFLPGSQHKQYYLNLRPDTEFKNGHKFTHHPLKLWGPRMCFAQDDLYTTEWAGVPNREIEQLFFGNWDRAAPAALDHFSDFAFDGESTDAFNVLLPYLSIQKLRTPKGLAWLQRHLKTRDKNQVLLDLQELQNLFCAIWTECVWQIADASESDTKFIISDNPVVSYNRECQPNSQWCLGVESPDVRFVATHTYFPLNRNKVLILTNLSWVRDPFQKPRTVRPNPHFLRHAMFKFTDIQVERILTEEEVREINFITKMSAHRYIAAADKDWLYPEESLASTNWRTLGDGYLLMPDPRHIHGGGQIIIGYEGGHSERFSEYGHRPWDRDFQNKKREEREWAAMEKFKAEWAATYGPEYRGVVYDMGPKSARRSMGEDYYLAQCESDKTYLKLPGELNRRKKLQRKR